MGQRRGERLEERLETCGPEGWRVVRGQAELGETLQFRFGTESFGAGSDEAQPRQRPPGR